MAFNHIPSHYRYAIPKIIRIPGLTVCRPFYTPKYVPTTIARNILKDPSHVLHLPTQQRVQTRPKLGLWWCASANINMDRNKTVRSYYIRRLRTAVKAALEAEGYDEAGVNSVGRTGVPKLYGTLDIQAISALFGAKNTEIRLQAKLIVRSMMRHCRGE